MMKIKIAILSLTLAFGLKAVAQPAPAPNPIAAGPIFPGITNVPTTTLDAETIGLSVGTVMHGAQTFESALNFRYCFGKVFAAAAEIQTGTSSQTVDSTGLYGQLRKNWAAAEIYGELGGRRNWETKKWEGVAGVGLIWAPVADPNSTILNKFSLFLVQRIVVNPGANRPDTETVAGVHYSF